MALFSNFSSFFFLSDLCLLISGLYLGVSSWYFWIFGRNPSDILLKYGQFSLDIRLLYLWYPADILDILRSVVQISSTMVPLDLTFLDLHDWEPPIIFKRQLVSGGHPFFRRATVRRSERHIRVVHKLRNARKPPPLRNVFSHTFGA